MNIAAITMVRNEAVMLPRWIGHYASQLGGVEHLHVIDHGSTGGSTSGLPCHVHPSEAGRLKQGFERDRLRLVNDLAASLLRDHDAVIFTDVDEFLVADPARHEHLPALYAARSEEEILAGIGVNVLHARGTEPALQPGVPVLAQRRLGIFIPHLCKPSFKRTPRSWRLASHGIEGPFRVDPELFMFHLKFADRALLATTARARAESVAGQTTASSWGSPPDELLRLLDELTDGVDPEGLPELAVAPSRLARIPQRASSGHWVATGRKQTEAMRRQPVRRIPERFRQSV